MKITSIPYSNTGYFNSIVIDYLLEKPALKNFYTKPPHIQAFKEILEAKPFEAMDRNMLVDILTEQYRGIEVNNNVKENIQAFKNENTYCIVTAHQLNIFAGPLYIIYKTISTINVCLQLKDQYPAYNFVPVFWLGTEDHDFDEINHCHIFGKTITWSDHQQGACGRYNPSSMAPVLEELKQLLGDSEHAAYIINLFSDAYLKHDTLAQSARYYLNELFKKFGLVVIDGDNAQLKKMCIHSIREEIINQSAYPIVNAAIESLDYNAQAKPREINLFYLEDNLRERIIEEDNIFTINNTTIKFTTEQILTEIELHPERFSPNVILRPIFQQKVLPSLAYVGGGGEIAYWLQLKNLFHHHQCHFPILMLRNSALWIDDALVTKITKTGIQYHDLFKEENQLINDHIKLGAGSHLDLSVEKNAIDKVFTALSEKVASIDVTLQKAVFAEMQNSINSLEKIEAKLLKAEKLKEEQTINQIKNIKLKLFPNGTLQERYDNFVPYYMKYGEAFIQYLQQDLRPFDAAFAILKQD